MNDSVYQSHLYSHSQHLDSTSSMQLAYYQSTQGDGQAQQWLIDQRKGLQPCARASGRSNSMLYTSEFADPSSNVGLAGQEMSMPYLVYSTSSEYPIMSLQGYQLHETVAGPSQFPHEPIYTSSPAFGQRQQFDAPTEPYQLSWLSGNSFQVPSQFADGGSSSVRYSPYTVKSQRRDINGADTPPSPLSLARSKHSSTSPSPGPLTPSIGHVSLQTETCAVGLESRPTSSDSSPHSHTRNEEVDPDRPYPCGSCRMAFARQHDLTRHSRVHSGETPYYCHGCRQGFRRSDARSRHWGKEAQCLALHQRLVEGTEEGRKLQKSLLRLGDKAGRVGTNTFRVHKPPTRSMRGAGAYA